MKRCHGWESYSCECSVGVSELIIHAIKRAPEDQEEAETRKHTDIACCLPSEVSFQLCIASSTTRYLLRLSHSSISLWSMLSKSTSESHTPFTLARASWILGVNASTRSTTACEGPDTCEHAWCHVKKGSHTHATEDKFTSVAIDSNISLF
jgi:hypothetical protein